MVQSDLAKRFNIKSIWEPYLKERGGQAYFEPRTAWAAPTYEYWWPFPFPAPGMPNAQGEVPTVNPGLVKAAEGPAGLASSAPTTMAGSPAPAAPPRGGNLTQDMESLLPGLAAGAAAGALVGRSQPRSQSVGAGLPNPLSFVGGGPTPVGPVGAGGPGAVGAGTVGAGIEGAAPLTMGAATPATAGAEALSESAGLAAGAADLFGQPGEVLTSGAYAPVTTAPAVAGTATAGAEAGALAGSSSAAQGAVGPAIGEVASGIGPGLAFGAVPLAIDLLTPGGFLHDMIFGPERESAQSRSNVEQAGARMTQAEAFSRANTPSDIAHVFNTIMGRGYSAADVSPEMIRRELGGSAFDRGATGGSMANINRGMLGQALARAFPTKNPYASMFPGFESWVPGANIYSEGYRGNLGGIQFGPTDEELARRANEWYAGGGAQL